MPITINGSGTVTGISAGGLPDDCITTAEIAAAAVTTAELGTNEASGLAKAWVNFNGTGTVAIRASFNVSSITDNGTGIYTVNFTTAMADANYCAIASKGGQETTSTDNIRIPITTAPTTSAIQVQYSNGNQDSAYVFVAIFR